MESFAVFFLPFFLLFAVLRILLPPLRVLMRLWITYICGLICLWLLNTTSGFTGISLAVNPITIAIAGFCGLPGIGLIAFLSVM